MNRPNPRDTSGHPDLADIDAVRAGEASPDIELHVRGCPQCAAALGELSALSLRAQAARVGASPAAADADEAVLAAIDHRANEIRWLRRGRRILTHPAWAAAAVIVLVSLSLVAVPPLRQAAWHRGQSATDMDRDGSTDIVDAYLLALALQGNRPVSSSWDLTGDAVVDDADVRAVARMAVGVGRSRT